MLSVLLEVSNKSLLLGLMIVLLVLLVLLTALGIVFIVALRKRAPVIKVVMAPPPPESDKDDDVQDEPEEEPAEEQLEMEEVAAIPEEPKTEEAQPAPPPAPAPEPEPEREEYEDDDDDESSTFVTEGVERVRYDRSFKAKHIQMKDESKEWYSTLKNELLSYQRVKSRLSWRKETFRIGRMPLARFVIRGKTLCLLLAIEPSGLQGTKFTVDDGVRCAHCHDTYCAEFTRLHNDSNMIALGEKVVGDGYALKIVETFLSTPFEGGRHQRRVDKITAIEKKYCK